MILVYRLTTTFDKIITTTMTIIIINNNVNNLINNLAHKLAIQYIQNQRKQRKEYLVLIIACRTSEIFIYSCVFYMLGIWNFSCVFYKSLCVNCTVTDFVFVLTTNELPWGTFPTWSTQISECTTNVWQKFNMYCTLLMHEL